MMITLLIAFAVGIVLGKVMLPVLHKLKFGQNIYELAPEAHKKKQGTPTMGGLVIAGAAIVAALVMNDYSVPMGQNMLLAMLLMIAVASLPLHPLALCLIETLAGMGLYMGINAMLGSKVQRDAINHLRHKEIA